MSVAQNDVNVLVVETRDQVGVAGDPFEIKVTAEVGGASHAAAPFDASHVTGDSLLLTP